MVALREECAELRKKQEALGESNGHELAWELNAYVIAGSPGRTSIWWPSAVDRFLGLIHAHMVQHCADAGVGGDNAHLESQLQELTALVKFYEKKITMLAEQQIIQPQVTVILAV